MIIKLEDLFNFFDDGETAGIEKGEKSGQQCKGIAEEKAFGALGKSEDCNRLVKRLLRNGSESRRKGCFIEEEK